MLKIKEVVGVLCLVNANVSDKSLSPIEVAVSLQGGLDASKGRCLYRHQVWHIVPVYNFNTL